MKAGSLRALPKAVTPENAPVSDRNGNFQEFLRTFEIASYIKWKIFYIVAVDKKKIADYILYKQ